MFCLYSSSFIVRRFLFVLIHNTCSLECFLLFILFLIYLLLFLFYLLFCLFLILIICFIFFFLWMIIFEKTFLEMYSGGCNDIPSEISFCHHWYHQPKTTLSWILHLRFLRQTWWHRLSLQTLVGFDKRD